MEIYGGIDLHSTNSVLVLKDETGSRVLRKRLPNDINSVLAMLRPFKASVRGLAVESTYNWYWLVDGLMDAEFKVHLANPAAMKQYEGVKYTDDYSDAEWLADMLRLGILPEGYIYPKGERPVRDLFRKRSQLVRQRTANILSIQNLVARNTGTRVSADSIFDWAAEDMERLFGGEAHLTLPVRASHAVVVALNEQISAIEKAVLSRARLRPEYKVLLTVSGVGKILALTIMLETGDIHRFPKVGDYASYCRCVGSKRMSNGKQKGTGNTKSGNRYLAWAYVEAANFAVRYEPVIRRFHDRKAAKTLKVVATKAVAHKLARACYHVLREQTPFDVGRAFSC